MFVNEDMSCYSISENSKNIITMTNFIAWSRRCNVIINFEKMIQNNDIRKNALEAFTTIIAD